MVIVAFGYILTRGGYISNDKQKWLSKLNLVFFTPCLLFSNIASVISFEKLLAYWPIPIFYSIFALVSFTAAHGISRAVHVKPMYRRFIVACTMFSNTNSLPVAVISSLALSEAGQILYWGDDDSQQAVAARGITYALLYAIFGNLLRWSYGYSLLSSEQDPNDDQDKPSNHHPGSQVSTNKASLNNQNGANETTALLSSMNQENDDDDDDARSTTKTLVVVDWARSIHQSMTPPLYAALLALIVGLVPFLKQLMYHSILYPTITSAIQSCSKASVPITLVCLGAQLKDISAQTSSSSDALVLEEEQEHRHVDPKPIATAIGIRMGLVPLIVIPLVLAFVKYNGVAWSSVSVATDPVFGVMMIILGCTPTAINLVQISQVTGAFEKEMLRVLFWSYGVICIPVFTMIIFAALNIVHLFI
ncbi:hypothetical protein K492DRAFT_219182 [Lichtheimia hyalospora FSU 10163]|nr:hypothetical protein K492DRAFT_219182 [Lichtheimia hyalospora FSU 10163]